MFHGQSPRESMVGFLRKSNDLSKVAQLISKLEFNTSLLPSLQST